MVCCSLCAQPLCLFSFYLIKSDLAIWFSLCFMSWEQSDFLKNYLRIWGKLSVYFSSSFFHQWNLWFLRICLGGRRSLFTSMDHVSESVFFLQFGYDTQWYFLCIVFHCCIYGRWGSEGSNILLSCFSDVVPSKI
jgi:hypothetical protein